MAISGALGCTCEYEVEMALLKPKINQERAVDRETIRFSPVTAKLTKEERKQWRILLSHRDASMNIGFAMSLSPNYVEFARMMPPPAEIFGVRLLLHSPIIWPSSNTIRPTSSRRPWRIAKSSFPRYSRFASSSTHLSGLSCPQRRPSKRTERFLNFFFVHVPPLQAALWQRRSEPVKVLRIRSGRRGGACGDL
jgi:hypothetical protein